LAERTDLRQSKVKHQNESNSELNRAYDGFQKNKAGRGCWKQKKRGHGEIGLTQYSPEKGSGRGAGSVIWLCEW